jgi:hypothetical protein
MTTDKKKLLGDFFETLEGLDSDNMMKMVEKYLSDEDVEIFVRHIENFYGITDDEELGMLAQLMVTGYLAAKHEDSVQRSAH